MCAYLVEDEVSDEHKEKSRHESREQGGDEPRRHWTRMKNVNEETTGEPCLLSLQLEILRFNSFLFVFLANGSLPTMNSKSFHLCVMH